MVRWHTLLYARSTFMVTSSSPTTSLRELNAVSAPSDMFTLDAISEGRNVCFRTGVVTLKEDSFSLPGVRLLLVRFGFICASAVSEVAVLEVEPSWTPVSSSLGSSRLPGYWVRVHLSKIFLHQVGLTV